MGSRVRVRAPSMGVHMLVGVFAGSALSQLKGSSAFPLYDPPLTAAPKPAAPASGYSGTSCTVELISSAALDNYNEVVHEPWRGLPSSCAGGVHGEKWDLITLQFDGAVAGVQFDRYGGLWFAGVELLRTTTPEPATGVDHGGTTWSITKDITDYAYIFATGTQYVRVTATFHMAADHSWSTPPVVLPLLDPTSSPWQITGLTNSSQPLQRPFAFDRLYAGRVKRLYLDVYASNHGGSEEFWYTTKSAYREINVYIDGCLASAFYPALVIYTGGICPLLWRPLVSLVALDIPAYRLDISAFAGLLNDGAAHTFSFDVVDADPPRSSGVWYIDPVLIMQLNTEALSPGYSGGVTDSSCLSPEAAALKRTVRVSPLLGITEGAMDFSVSGTNREKNGKETSYTHSYALKAQNKQPKDGPTEGTMSTTVVTGSVIDTQVWSYTVDDDSSYNKETFLLKADVKLRKERSKTVSTGQATPVMLATSLAQNNSGIYNRSQSNHTLIFAEDNNSTESFRFTAGSPGHGPCFTRDIVAHAGHVNSDIINKAPLDVQYPCYAFINQLPGMAGLRVCGTEFCGFLL